MKLFLKTIIFGALISMSTVVSADVYVDTALKQLQSISESNIKNPRDLANLQAAKQNLALVEQKSVSICTVSRSGGGFHVEVNGSEIFRSMNRPKSDRYLTQLVLEGKCVEGQ